MAEPSKELLEKLAKLANEQVDIPPEFDKAFWEHWEEMLA